MFVQTIVAVMLLFISFSSAQAVIKIEQATAQAGVAYVQGNGAAKGAMITWDGFAVTTANKNNGGFSFVGVLPADCTGQLSDGVPADTVTVRVLGCTPVTAGGPPAPVPQTGQTTSYGTRDDGALQKGVPFPNPRFTDNGNGTITDNLTRLIWLQDPTRCFGMGFSGTQTMTPWAVALTSVNSLSSGNCPVDGSGLTDGSAAGNWRMPNLRELQSLVDYNGNNPALPAGAPFTCMDFVNEPPNPPSTCFRPFPWSSTTYVGDQALGCRPPALSGSCAWSVNFDDGTLGPTPKGAGNLTVLPVRGGS
jgi:hypothetical protein